jgi:NADH-quinone oxidoreductase subunit L
MFWVFGTIGAVLSAGYVGRLLFLTFFGRPRSDQAEHAHESAPVMWGPLVVLAVGAATVGLVNVTPEGRLATFLEPAVGAVQDRGFGLTAFSLSVIGGTIAVAMLVLTWLAYGSGRVDWMALRERLQPLPRTLANGWYVDSAYRKVIVAPARAGAAIVAYFVDARVIDGIANGVGAGVRQLANVGRRLQTGFVRSYALAFFLGAVVLLAYVGVRL